MQGGVKDTTLSSEAVKSLHVCTRKSIKRKSYSEASHPPRHPSRRTPKTTLIGGGVNF